MAAVKKKTWSLITGVTGYLSQMPQERLVMTVYISATKDRFQGSLMTGVRGRKGPKIGESIQHSN